MTSSVICYTVRGISALFLRIAQLVLILHVLFRRAAQRAGRPNTTGYLMSSHESNHRSEYVCVDRDAERGYRDGGRDGGQDGARLYHVAAECDGGPGRFGFCDSAGYQHRRELTCTVCSK